MQLSSSRIRFSDRHAGTIRSVAIGFVALGLAAWHGTAAAAPPVAVDDFVSTSSAIDSSAPFNTGALGNDFDPDDDPILPISVQAISGGSPSIQNGDEVWFTPSQYFVGTASFTYTIEAAGETDSATVTVDVLNRSPSANNCQDSVESGVLTQVLIICGEYPDPEQGPLTVISVTQPANGSTALIPGQPYYIEYVSDPGYTGIDAFQYTIEDQHGATSSGTITMNVTPFVNDPPVANDDSDSTRSGPTAGLPLPLDVLANDSDPDGDPLQYVNLTHTDPSNGTITRQGLLIYTPNAGFEGVDSFSYEIDDGNGGLASATVTITVTASQPPVANDDAYDVDAFPAETEIDFLANDSDPDGDLLSYSNVTIATGPAHGQVLISCVGQCTPARYQSQIGYSGPDSFTYTIDDGLGSQTTATVNLNVLPSASGPTAIDDSAGTLVGQAVSIGVLANDTSGDGSPLVVEDVTQPANGTVVINAGATSVTYTPAPGFFGQDTFTYLVANDLGSDSGTVTVDVAPVNQPPVAVDDSYTTSVDTPINFDPLANDSDPDGDTLTIEALTGGASNGTVVVESDGTYTYTPNAGFIGTDFLFNYFVTDGNGGTDQASVSVRVLEGNAPPNAVDDVASTAVDTPIVIDVLANDSDPNGDPISINSVSSAQFGSVVLVTGGIQYTPPSGFVGQDTFTYDVIDSAENISTAIVRVNVAPPNSPPIAVDDAAVTDEGTPVTIDVLANDSDVDGDPITITDATSPANGTLTPVANGFTYTPSAGFTGTDQFTYFVTDGQDGSASATVTVTVNAITPPQLPTAVITGLMALYPDTDGQPGETVSASGGSSTAIEGAIATYVWFVNDTEVLRGSESDVSLDLIDGENTVALIVIDEGGLESEPVIQTVGVAVLSSNPNLTPNQKETAAALEDTCSSLSGSSSLTPEQQQLLETCRSIIVDAGSAQEVEQALDALSGEQVTAAQTSGVDFSSMQLTNIGSRIKALRAGARGASVAGLNIMHDGQRIPLEQLGDLIGFLLDEDDEEEGEGRGGGASGDDDEAGGLFDDRLGLFLNGNVIFGEKDDSALEAGYDFDSIGLTAGADYRFTDSVVAGFAIGYGESSSDFTQNRGSLDSDGYSTSIFGSYYDQGGYIDGILSYGRSSFDALRRIDFTVGGVQTLAEARGDTDASTFGAGFGAGWDFNKGALTFGPNVALSYIEVDVDGYTETGAGGYNLIYDDQTGKSFTIRAGGHASYAFSGKWGVLTPQVRFDFVKELENDSQLVSARFAADPNSAGFVLATDVPDEEYLVWGLGLAGVFANGLSAFFDYQTVSSLDLIESHDFTVGIRYQRAFR